MKTYNNILYLFLLGIFVLSSCAKQEEFVSSLHIVSFITPDEPFKVQVQKTAPTLGDHSDLNVKNAFVLIENLRSQELIKMFHQGNGVYESNGTKPLPGYDYQIIVSADGFPDAAATTYVPDLGDVAVILDEFGNESNTVGFTFKPTMLSFQPTNFFAYELVVKPAEVDSQGGEIPVDDGTGEQIGNPDDAIKTLRPVMGAVIDGSNVPVETINNLDVDIEELSVRIVAVSSEFYDYLITQSGLSSHVSSSVLPKNSPVYSNFVGDAYGIFGGFNEKTIKLVQ